MSRVICASSTQRPKGHSNLILKLLEVQGIVSLFSLCDCCTLQGDDPCLVESGGG
jgi:hypothetical protein